MTVRTAPPGAVGQVRAVVALRAAAVRGRARRTVALGLGAIPLVLLGAVLGGVTLPAGGSDDALLLMPTAWLGFTVAVVVATASSGARLLLPRGQTSAFPLTPARPEDPVAVVHR